MRWILALSFILFLAPFANAQDDVGGGVQSMDLSSHGGPAQFESSFNAPTPEAQYQEIAKQLDLDATDVGHTNTSALDSKSQR